MWIDERGSEVLEPSECHRLLALAAKQGRVAHLGIAQDGAPLVVPVDFTVHGPDPLVRIGEGLFDRIGSRGMVALEVDDPDADPPWSVLVRGETVLEEAAAGGSGAPVPRVAEAGHRIVRIRADQVTGRRLGTG